MLEWIVALILFFCGVVLISLYYFEIRENRELWLKLKVANDAIDPNSSKRLESPERFIKPNGQKTNLDSVFAATFEAVKMDSIEESLKTMVAKANREILIVSPWITYGAWSRIKGRVFKFLTNGGELEVFMKGNADDFSGGFSNQSVVDEMRTHGGKVHFVPELHAKLYVVDRREVLITSANLIKNGLDNSYEAGVWTCDPVIVKDVCGFVNKLVVT